MEPTRFAKVFLCASLGIFALSNPAARAAALKPGDVLVTTDFSTSPATTLYEYTPSGTKVQSWSIPYPTGNRNSTEDLRDIVVGPDGNIDIFNGTFSPYLTTLNPVTGTYTNYGGGGAFSVAGNVSYGGVAAFGSYVFVPDQNTNGSPAVGVVRYNLADGSSQRVLSARDYEKVAIGGNGLLYALSGDEQPGTTGVEVYDPTTMALIRTVLFSEDIRAVTADASGNMFAADWDGSVEEFDPTGNLLNSRAMGLGNLSDLDLSTTGQIVVAGGSDRIGLTTTSLTSQTSFTTTNSFFVAFTTATVPEPTGAGVMGVASVVVLIRRRRAAGRSSSGTGIQLL